MSLNMDKRLLAINNKAVFISCIVPIYNEANHINAFIETLNQTLSQLTTQYEIIIVDDGSRDASIYQLSAYLDKMPIKLLQFSRNFGKEAALTAGLNHSQGEVVVLIDGDFQHPMELIATFLAHWAEGYDMVYGVQQSRATQSTFKRWASRAFYQLMGRITKINIPPNAGDFRLLDRRAVNALNNLEERERFMKGLYAWVGFNSKGVLFTAKERASGQSAWQFWHLVELALVGITSFSNAPLRFSSIFGFALSLIAFIYGSAIVIDTLMYGADIPGYATIVVAIMFFGGIQLLSIGILGEYVAKIFNEIKRRPNYIVADKRGFKD